MSNMKLRRRLPRKLKKEKKKDGFYLLMKASVPIVREVFEYGSRKYLATLLTGVKK